MPRARAARVRSSRRSSMSSAPIASAGDRTIRRPTRSTTTAWCSSRRTRPPSSTPTPGPRCSTPPRAGCGSAVADVAAGVGLDQERVIEEAAALADSAGADAVTLAALAARLGVRSQSLYAHVDGLDGLRHDLAVLGQQALADRLGRAVMGRAGEEALRALCNAYARFAAE